MNTLRKLGLLCLVIVPAVAEAEISDSQVWSKTFTVTGASPRLSISNIWGNVRVRPGPDGEITVTADEHRSAADQAMFDRSLVLLKLDTYADAEGVSMIVGQRDNRWDNWNHCQDCRVDYQFDVLVPKGTLVDVSTVMDGKVDVSGIQGAVSASNVNGPVEVAGMHDCAKVESVNGKVNLGFAAAPGRNCNIETINGDVTLTMPAGSGLDVSLDIFNGKVFTEFATDTFAVPAEVQYEETDGRHKYRIQQFAGLRLEGGGPVFSISSMNGDVRIQKN
jgi:hypothetical protein